MLHKIELENDLFDEINFCENLISCLYSLTIETHDMVSSKSEKFVRKVFPAASLFIKLKECSTLLRGEVIFNLFKNILQKFNFFDS